jgi:hypothetical protein
VGTKSFELIPNNESFNSSAKGVATMTDTQIQPIKCHDCGNLALAQMDGTPLCARCLFSSIDVRQLKELPGKITPLPLMTSIADPSILSTPA